MPRFRTRRRPATAAGLAALVLALGSGTETLRGAEDSPGACAAVVTGVGDDAGRAPASLRNPIGSRAMAPSPRAHRKVPAGFWLGGTVPGSLGVIALGLLYGYRSRRRLSA